MRTEDIATLVEARPFVPFRLCLSDGSSYEIRHPEFILLSRFLVEVGLQQEGRGRIVDNIVHIAPLHIVKAEMLQPA